MIHIQETSLRSLSMCMKRHAKTYYYLISHTVLVDTTGRVSESQESINPYILAQHSLLLQLQQSIGAHDMWNLSCFKYLTLSQKQVHSQKQNVCRQLKNTQYIGLVYKLPRREEIQRSRVATSRLSDGYLM